MYIQLMQKNQNAAALDSGLTLMAAGLSNSQATRSALINAASGGSGGRGAGGITSADIINLQKQDQENQNRLLRQSMLGGLMKEYNMSPETVKYLEASGQLDEVIKHKNTQNLVQQEGADGSKAFYNATTGQKIIDISPAKVEEGEFVDTPEGKQLRSKRTGLPMGPAAGKAPETEFIEGPQGKQLRSKTTGEPIGPAAGLTIPDAAKTDAMMLDGINQERVARGIPPLSMEEYITTIKRDPKAPANALDMENLAAVNKGLVAEGKPPITMGEYLLKYKHPAGTSIYVGQDGIQYPKPPEGYDYERHPDGKVMIGPDRMPIMRAVSPKAAGEEKETAQDIADKEKKASDLLKKEHKERVSAVLMASNVGDAIDTSLALADKVGATGTFAKWARNIAPVTGMSWDTIDSKVKTIDANNVVSALNAMRAASPTGGALGNVTEQENKMLAAIIASTNVYQETGEFKKGLIRIKAAMLTMAEQKYDDADGAARFKQDLQEKIDELTMEQQNKKGSGITIRPR